MAMQQTRRALLAASVSALSLLAGHALAEDSAAPTDIVVTANRLTAARQSIEPSLGATDYSISNATIQALPGGDNQQLNQVVLQLPGVVQDSFGQIHVRDDHNGIQYRINGVILPEGISVFGQTLSPRLVEKLDLLTGALARSIRPADRRHHRHHHQERRLQQRRRGVASTAAATGPMSRASNTAALSGQHSNFFVSGDFRRTQLGIENPDGGTVHRRPRPHRQLDACSPTTTTLIDNNGPRVPDRRAIPTTVSRSPTRRAWNRDLGLTSVNGQTQYPSVASERHPAGDHRLRHR